MPPTGLRQYSADYRAWMLTLITKMIAIKFYLKMIGYTSTEYSVSTTQPMMCDGARMWSTQVRRIAISWYSQITVDHRTHLSIVSFMDVCLEYTMPTCSTLELACMTSNLVESNSYGYDGTRIAVIPRILGIPTSSTIWPFRPWPTTDLSGFWTHQMCYVDVIFSPDFTRARDTEMALDCRE